MSKIYEPKMISMARNARQSLYFRNWCYGYVTHIGVVFSLDYFYSIRTAMLSPKTIPSWLHAITKESKECCETQLSNLS